jgi:hypothetical protein
MTTEINCEHFIRIDESNVTPKTDGCEECEREGTNWVAIRMCLICSHVGCCDSSIGLHATKHFQKLVIQWWLHYLTSYGNCAMYINNIIIHSYFLVFL